VVSSGHAFTAQDVSRLPPNPAIEAIPDAIAAAAKAHGAPGGCVVMVVQPGERNQYDQQVLTASLATVVVCAVCARKEGNTLC
jgi:hypothetical protein